MRATWHSPRGRPLRTSRRAAPRLRALLAVTAAAGMFRSGPPYVASLAFAAGISSSRHKQGVSRREGGSRAALLTTGTQALGPPISTLGSPSGGLNDGSDWSSGGGERGRSEMSPEDKVRLLLLRGSNFYAVNTEEDLDMLLDQSAQTGRVTVVDYYAPWCRACQKFLKGMQKIAAEDDFGGVAFASVNFELARELCRTKKVDKLPTLEIYNGGEFRQRWVGANKGRLLERLSGEMEATKLCRLERTGHS